MAKKLKHALMQSPPPGARQTRKSMETILPPLSVRNVYQNFGISALELLDQLWDAYVESLYADTCTRKPTTKINNKHHLQKYIIHNQQQQGKAKTNQQRAQQIRQDKYSTSTQKHKTTTNGHKHGQKQNEFNKLSALIPWPPPSKYTTP